jgi:hypothetical protein
MHLEALTKESRELLPVFGSMDEFTLAGGTAVALQLGHRVSVDFDFFSPQHIPSSLLSRVETHASSRSLSTLVNNRNELTLTIDGVKVTFLHYPFDVFEKKVVLGGIHALPLDILTVTKAYTIGRRGSLKDYVDLYALLSAGVTTMQQVIARAEEIYADAFNGRLFLEQLVYADDVEQMPMRFLKEPMEMETILSYFASEIRGLSSDFLGNSQ